MAATSFTMTGPATADCTVASTNFTVTPVGGTYTGTITLSDSGAGGAFTPTSLTWAASSAAKTFTYTPTLWGSCSISATASPTLTPPSPITFLAKVQLGSSGTAPSGNQSLAFGGFSFFTTSAWWQEFARDISGDPVDPNSAAIMANFTGSPNVYVSNLSTTTANGGNSLYGIPINVVAGTQATSTVTAGTYWAESDVNQTTHEAQVPMPADPSIEGWYSSIGAFPTSQAGDQHCLIAVRDETTGGIDTLWELYGTYSSDGGTTWQAAGVAMFDITTGYPRLEGYSSADAAGLALLPLLLKYEEVESGDIGHCVRGTFSNYMMMSRYT